ncbi:helix-turn-helix transcriptional regulator [Bacteroides sp. 224]|uniref:helix-turn-helix transcriptional regulator n=1 Tax=Bacteroides sp. 224 TaxID=2302936 RepID=UPI0013D173CD|nr:helix-turn-helix transcriptional regulator [Bacteroides sp. 224]NDV64191.1 AraC family transcriptional regulator [Bacteroides sp. 224]
MTKDDRYKRLTDCSLCTKASDGIMVLYKQAKGFHAPSDKCTQNCMLFMLKGELLINSEEYPGTILRSGQFILQAIGSKLELLALSNVEYIIYWFNELPQICDIRFQKVLEMSEAPLTYTPLITIPRLSYLLNDVAEYLQEKEKPCGKFIELKCYELIYILTCYYPLPQLSIFFYPISRYTESFHYFVMQNYDKVKNVEEFAHLGGYTTTTFRRLFKNMYGEPVYEWILNKKREGILQDLQYTKQRITEISNRYGFDSLSHFAHFCKASFGDSPRALRTRAAKGEILQMPAKQDNKSSEE